MVFRELDVPRGLRLGCPDDPPQVFPPTFVVGNVRTKAREFERFWVWVATPEALRVHAEERADADAHDIVLRDRALVVVSSYDVVLIERHLHQLVKTCNRPTWPETVEALRRYFKGEWEDYRPT